MRKVSMKGKRESFLVVSCRAQISLSLCFSLVLISPSRQTRVGKSNYKLLNVKQELPYGTWSNCHALLYFLTSFHSPGQPRTPSVEQADLVLVFFQFIVQWLGLQACAAMRSHPASGLPGTFQTGCNWRPGTSWLGRVDAKPENSQPVSGNHTVEGENWLPPVVQSLDATPYSPPHYFSEFCYTHENSVDVFGVITIDENSAVNS